jgi:dTDP-L-rhamnose 4-epimerase
MIKKILITGGAGFIGSHLADELLVHGYEVRVLDNLDQQVHGRIAARPSYLSHDVELLVGDVRDEQFVARALVNIDAVYHLAAAVGVGQSMYKIGHYVSTNDHGTAILLQALIKRRVTRLIVASSMSIYGEGLYRTSRGTNAAALDRKVEDLNSKTWEVRDTYGQELIPTHTPESKVPAASSIYAISKYSQEQMCLAVGHAYRVPTIALRFFNVFGPRQALSNPYTGLLAIVASRLLNNRRPIIYEDGLQQRDFVSVKDVARACRLALDPRTPADNVYNVGTGNPSNVRDVVRQLARVLGKDFILPEITGKYRVGDVRHCFADISKARRLMGYEAQVSLADGLEEFAGWLKDQIAIDHVPEAAAELDARGLAI